MNSSSTVSAELGLRLVVPQQTIVPLVASLFYSKEDPYAIRIAFHVGLDEPVEWIFARDLLSLGIEGREGLGDVVVWPSSGSADGAPGRVLNIELSSPFGQAHFEAPIKEISDFLARTYAIVPEGEESDFVDVAAELTDLLKQAVGSTSFPARAPVTGRGKPLPPPAWGASPAPHPLVPPPPSDGGPRSTHPGHSPMAVPPRGPPPRSPTGPPPGPRHGDLPPGPRMEADPLGPPGPPR